MLGGGQENSVDRFSLYYSISLHIGRNDFIYHFWFPCLGVNSLLNAFVARGPTIRFVVIISLRYFYDLFYDINSVSKYPTGEYPELLCVIQID